MGLRGRLGALRRATARSTCDDCGRLGHERREPPRHASGGATSRPLAESRPQRAVRHHRPPRPREGLGPAAARAPERDLRRYYEPAVEAFAEAGVAVEVSTAGLRKPVGEIYPARPFLEMCLDAGLPLALSSDAHVPAHVGSGYEQALELLDELGVRELAVFEGRRGGWSRSALRGRRGGVVSRAGIGYDSHRLVEGRPLILGGVRDRERARASKVTPTPTCSPTRSSTRCSARPGSATSASTSPTPTSAGAGRTRSRCSRGRGDARRAWPTIVNVDARSCWSARSSRPTATRSARGSRPRSGCGETQVNVKASTRRADRLRRRAARGRRRWRSPRSGSRPAPSRPAAGPNRSS